MPSPRRASVAFTSRRPTRSPKRRVEAMKSAQRETRGKTSSRASKLSEQPRPPCAKV